MSALAARRAAALALAASQEVSSTDLSTAPTPPASKNDRSPTPDVQVTSESEEEAVILPPPSAKRKRSRKSSPVGPVPREQARYSGAAKADESTSQRIQIKSKPSKRRSTPPAPELEQHLTLQLDAESSGTGSDDVLSEDDEYEAARDDVDEGRATWTVPSTSVESTPGPSRTRPVPASVPTSQTNSSTFVPEQGVNICMMTQNELRTAGFTDGPSGSGVIVSLAPEETLLIAGSYTLTPLSGHISIASTTISSTGESHAVFAPTSHPIPAISASSSKQVIRASVELGKLKLPKSYKRDGTMVLIRENVCGIDGLRYGAVPGFAHIWLDEQGCWGLRGVHPVIGSFAQPVYPLVCPDTWSSAIAALPTAPSSDAQEVEASYSSDALHEPFLSLVKGPKRSGKSTLARTLLNNLLGSYARVAWLECDLGQGEFGCGGVVGLWILDKPVLGPSFTHPLVPYRAHYLGTYTPLTCPDEYIASIRHLVDQYRYEIQHSSFPLSAGDKVADLVPLVVNTQGWVKGLGEELLRGIEAIVRPTHTYSFDSVDEEGYSGPGWSNSPTWQTAQLPFDGSYPGATEHADADEPTAVQRFKLEPAPVSPLQARFTPADLRVLSTLSYLHSALTPTGRVKWDFSAPLLAHQPWEVSFGSGGTIDRVYLIGEGNEGVVQDDLAIALNGSLVALVEVDTSSEESDLVYVQGRPSPQGEAINFLGLALVRAVLSSPAGTEGKLHILTPLAPAQLSRCRGIVKNGAVELPTPGMMDWTRGQNIEDGLAGRRWEDVPFFDVSGVDVVGGERRRFRKNIMRKGM
ncbi:hypothetical protein IAU60_003511 [Kwoniella sp. DSM 27419]